MVLEKVWSKYRNVAIVGDLNTDITRSESGEMVSTYGKKLLGTLQHFNYSVVNDQPARVTATYSTLIDHIISSKPEMVKETKCLESGISGHMLVYASLTTKVKRPPPKIINARTYSKFNTVNFRKDIEEAPWSVCSIFDDPDDVYWAWSHIFNNISERHAPHRRVKVRQNSLPWITPQIRHLMNLRYKTFLRDIMDINITYESVSQGLLNLKPDKACGPDKVSPKLLKSAGRALIPSLLSLYNSSAKSNSVSTNGKMPTYCPCTRKTMKLKRITIDPYLCFVCPGNSWRHVCHRPSLTTYRSSAQPSTSMGVQERSFDGAALGEND